MRVAILAATILLSWLWFSTQKASETCVKDGLDGTCLNSLGDSPFRLLEGTSKILVPPSLRSVNLVTRNQTRPNQTIPDHRR